MHTKLFIPGPVDVREEILSEMSHHMIGHRTIDASNLQRNISNKMRKILYTEEEILLSTSSGSGLMEGAIRSCTFKKAVVFSIGAFGKKWYEMGKNNGLDIDIVEVGMGNFIESSLIDKTLKSGKYDLMAITHNETSTGMANPLEEIAEVMKNYKDIILCVDMVSSAAGHKVEVDKLGIDIAITSSQKCLGVPPGLSICSFSKKAIERAQNIENRGYYFDLLRLYNHILKSDYQYPTTAALSQMFALDRQLDYILNIEGLENRFSRHLNMAKIVRTWAKDRFELFGDERCLSRTVTAIKNNRNIDIKSLNKELKNRGMMISNGYGDLKDKTFRIAHMADTQIEDINLLLNNINDILKL